MLLLLADTRKQLLWLWLISTAFLVALVFSQTLNGQYEDIESKAWAWVFIQLLPTLLLLLVAVVLNKNPSKVLLRTTFRALYLGGVAYLLLVLVTLLALPIATRSQSVEAYLQLSYYWLLPIQALLLVVFGLLYFRKGTFFRPNAAIMQEYVSKKREFARRSGNILQIQAFNLLIQDNGLDTALDFLKNNSKGNNDLILLQSQSANWKYQRDLNLVEPDVLQRELNRMTLWAIDLIETI